MARFFTGGIESFPRVEILGESRMGGLGLPPAVIKPAQAQAFARVIKDFIARRMKSPDFRSLSNRDRNKIIKTFVAALTKGALDMAVADLSPLDHLQDDANQPIDQQEGYTLQWDDQHYDCFRPWNGEFKWFHSGVELPHACYNFGVEWETMGEVNNTWKMKFKKAQQVGIGGKTVKGFLKTGTPGAVGNTRPLPRQAWGRNKITRTITAMNPWTQLPGQWSQTRQIPEKLVELADDLADLEEPFAEARSRQEGDPQGATDPQIETEFSFGRGKPKVVITSLKFPEPPKGKESKEILGIDKGSILGRLLNGVTESLDAFNVAYEALDASVKPRGRTSQLQRIELVLTNIGSIDVDKLIEGLIANEIEDRIIGSISGAAARATAKSTGKPIAGFIGTSRGAAIRSAR